MIYISIGSNLGNRLNYIKKAIELLKVNCLHDIRCSIVLETESILPPDAPDEWNKPFLNMVVSGKTNLSPSELLKKLKDIEQILGRPTIYKRWSPRVIDLDILLWDDCTIKTADLIIPHPELKNRPFLLHLLAMMGIKQEQISYQTFSKSFAISPSFVGIVNVTSDSFSDGGLYNSPDNAIKQIMKLMEEGSSVIEIGAQSTRPAAIIQTPEEEYSTLKPVLDAIKPLMENGTIAISIDSFWPSVIHKILDRYPVSWINDVKGELDDITLKLIAKHQCKLCIMHSLGIPPKKDIILSNQRLPLDIILDWAKNKIEDLLDLGFEEGNIIIDPGIGFGKSIYQNMEIIANLEQLKSLGVKILIGHSRKSYMEAFSVAQANNRDIETIAISALIKNKVDFLRVHNVADHMRFFTAQQAVMGGSYI